MMEEEIKVCSKYERALDLSAFSPSLLSKHEVQNICKECKNKHFKYLCQKRKTEYCQDPKYVTQICNMMETKICCTCKKELSLDNFYRNKKSKNGLGTKCRECCRKYNKEVRAKNDAAYLARTPNTKTCFSCSRELPCRDFRVCSINIDGLQALCKDCSEDYLQKYRRGRRITETAFKKLKALKAHKMGLPTERAQLKEPPPSQVYGRPQRNQVKQWWDE